MTVGELIDQMRDLRSQGKLDKAIRRVHAEVDHWMWDRRLGDCDRLCQIATPGNVGVTLGIAVLAITVPVKSKLPHRPILYDRLAGAIAEQGEEPPATLHGLA